MAKTFKNKHFTKRDYECTNVVACIADQAPNENYIECCQDVITPSMTQLWIETIKGYETRFYGWL